MMSCVRGRLAPSPTGLLHLGNAWAFLLAWLAARAANGNVVLRMEDIDPDRSRAEYAAMILEDLRWLGLDWEEGPDVGGPCAPYVQQQRLPLYETALARLNSEGMIYPCYCTRKELRSLAGARVTWARRIPAPAATFLPKSRRDGPNDAVRHGVCVVRTTPLPLKTPCTVPNG